MFNSTKPVLITLNMIPYFPWKEEHIVKIIKEKLMCHWLQGTLTQFCIYVHEWCWGWIGDHRVQILTVSSRRVWRDLMKRAETPSAGYQRANHPIDIDSSKICECWNNVNIFSNIYKIKITIVYGASIL